MPGSQKERRTRPEQLARLSLAAQSPSPAPAQAPAPATLLSRVLGERYPSGGGERQTVRPAREERGHAAPEQGWEGPPRLPLPPQVARGLAAPPAAPQSLPPKGPAWDRLHDPLPASPLAEATLRLMCQAIAAAGLEALRPRVLHDCRRAASIALTGREA